MALSMPRPILRSRMDRLTNAFELVRKAFTGWIPGEVSPGTHLARRSAKTNFEGAGAACVQLAKGFWDVSISGRAGKYFHLL